MCPASALLRPWTKCLCSFFCSQRQKASSFGWKAPRFISNLIFLWLETVRISGRIRLKGNSLPLPRLMRPALLMPPAAQFQVRSPPPANGAHGASRPTTSFAESRTRPSRNQGKQPHPEKESLVDDRAYVAGCGRVELQQRSPKRTTIDTSDRP
jgi:hypothetical protein